MEAVALMIVGSRGVGKRTFLHTLDATSLAHTSPITLIDGTGSTAVGIFMDELAIALASLDLYAISITRESLTPEEDLKLGFCILIDSTKTHSFYEARAFIEFLTPIGPYIIVANKQDREEAMTVGQIRREMDLPDETIILPCVATERASVANVLNTLLPMVRPDIQERIT